MEIMEEGNLIDRVRILLQRDQTFYNEHQRVLQENVCPTMVGGFLDFPCITTFVASKIVTWWEESYFLLFRAVSSIFQGNITVDYTKNEEDNISVGKSINAKNFVSLISQSSAMLLEHLHSLSQEALDHADLSVLTGTIGTATLIRNTMWIYNQQLIKTNYGVSLSQDVKTYQNMSEALAERLLDLHCRLISLYILQDMDCLNWTAEHAFLEGERSSYTIQMWWFYVQGTQEDLWHSMPPKTAARIFSGILNESLTILTSRYMQVRPNRARNELVVADLSNILLCMFKLLPAICENSDELLGRKVTSNIIKDIHVKCHLLLSYFLIRATPLSLLYKNFKDGLTNASCTKQKKDNCIEPWVIFAISERNETIPTQLMNFSSLPDDLAAKYELLVLLSQAQPVWPLLLKILRMNSCSILYEIFYHVIVEMEESEYIVNQESCKGFLCNDDCVLISSIQSSILQLLLEIENKNDIENVLIKVLEQVPEKWTIYFSHSQIWNQNRPLWIQTLLSSIQPTTQYIIKIVSQSSKKSTTEILYEYVDLIKKTANCLPDSVILIAALIENNLPPDVIPLGDSTLIQLMSMSLYDELGNESPISEALCKCESQALGQFQKDTEQLTADVTSNLSYINYTELDEILIHHILTKKPGRNALKVLYKYLKYHADWLHIKLRIKSETRLNTNLLHKMFYIGESEYDQVLSGTWTPKWAWFLNMPLGLTAENIQDQLSMRPEFWQDIKLTKHDQMVVSHIKSLGKAFE